jgi:hypothetical protein
MTWEPFYKFDKFFIKDTLPDGNCQFRAISEALRSMRSADTEALRSANPEAMRSDAKLNHKQLRKLIAEYIINLSDEEFKDIINYYRIEKTNHEFIGKWDPFKVKTKSALARHIKKSGFHFQGDNLTLSLLSRILDVDFIIFGKESITELSHTHPRIIMLYYTGDHYQTIGIKEKGIRKIITLFDRHNLPDTIRILIDKYYFLENEIREYYSQCKNEQCPFTLPTLYRHLESKMRSFSINKKEMTQIINDLITKASPVLVHARVQKVSPNARVQKVSPNARVQKVSPNARVQKVSPKKASVKKSPKKASVPVRIRKTSHK